MESTRCKHLPDSADTGPGEVDECTYCERPEDCINSGGTTDTVKFLPADMVAPGFSLEETIDESAGEDV